MANYTGMTHYPQAPVGNAGSSVLDWIDAGLQGEGFGRYGDRARTAIEQAQQGNYGGFGDLIGDAMGGGIGGGLLGIIGKKQAGINAAMDFAKKQGAEITPEILPTSGPDALYQYGKSLSNPAVRRRETMRLSNPNTVYEQPVLPDRKILEPEGLLGRILVPNVGDPSGIGTIKQLMGVPLDSPVAVQAGPDYSRWQQGTGRGWASMLGAAQSKNNNLLAAMDLSGEAPVGVYSRMGDRSIDFSRPVAESLVAQIDSIKVPKKVQQQFNSEIRNLKIGGRKPFSDFKGIDTPEGRSQITGESGMEGAGDLRKAIVGRMSAAKWRDQGFPQYHDVADTIIADDLAGMPKGYSGYTMYEANPQAGLLADSQHQSYSHAIPGEYLGGLLESVPAEVMYPDIFRTLSTQKNVAGKPFSYDQKLGSLMASHHFQKADERWLENLQQYLGNR